MTLDSLPDLDTSGLCLVKIAFPRRPSHHRETARGGPRKLSQTLCYGDDQTSRFRRRSEASLGASQRRWFANASGVFWHGLLGFAGSGTPAGSKPSCTRLIRGAVKPRVLPPHGAAQQDGAI